MAETIVTREGEFAGTSDERLETTGSFTALMGGAAAIVLAVLGLVHIAPTLLAAIATIVIGASFLVAGGTVAARFTKTAGTPEMRGNEALGEGMAMESLCGAAGVILGILALVGAGPTTLLPVAAIVFGGGLLVASSSTSRWYARRTYTGAYRSSQEFTDFGAGPEVLIALAAIVLGILALAGLSPVILSLVAFLSLGFAVMLGGFSLTTWLSGVFSA